MTENAVTTDDAPNTPPGWRVGGGVLMTAFACRSAAQALELVAAIGELAESANHHPDVDWRYNQVFVTTVSHDVGAITERDTQLAAQISRAAANVGAAAKPEKARKGA